MRAFFKRRWILLSCAVLLSWLSLSSSEIIYRTHDEKIREEFGVRNGHMIWSSDRIEGGDELLLLSISIWPLLTVVAGLIVFRELWMAGEAEARWNGD
jgi:hypothetical protein